VNAGPPQLVVPCRIVNWSLVKVPSVVVVVDEIGPVVEVVLLVLLVVEVSVVDVVVLLVDVVAVVDVVLVLVLVLVVAVVVVGGQTKSIGTAASAWALALAASRFWRAAGRQVGQIPCALSVSRCASNLPRAAASQPARSFAWPANCLSANL
jgi:hypothetical protein